MKVQLQLKAAEVHYVEAKCIQIQTMDFKVLDKDSKRAYTVILDVLDKVMSKAKTINRSQNLFDEKKKHKLSLKFHEAYYLEKFLHGPAGNETDPYKQNLSRKVLAQLNQKML